MTPEKT